MIAKFWEKDYWNMTDQELLILAVKNNVKIPMGGDIFRPGKYTKEEKIRMLKKNSPLNNSFDKSKLRYILAKINGINIDPIIVNIVIRLSVMSMLNIIPNAPTNRNILYFILIFNKIMNNAIGMTIHIYP